MGLDFFGKHTIFDWIVTVIHRQTTENFTSAHLCHKPLIFAALQKVKNIFLFIFSFYVLSLVMFTCHDECKKEKIENIVSATKHQHETTDDTCSPFCICTCCASTVMVAQQVQVNGVHAIHLKAFASYLSSSNQAFFHSFWQPPRNGI